MRTINLKCAVIGKLDSMFVKIRSGGKRIGAGSERGAALLEFVLVAPLLFLVMTGLTSFGMTLHNYLVLTNAVNAGAQQLSFSRGETTNPCATAYSAISAAAPSLTSSLSLTFVINGTSYSGNTCAAGASGMVQGASAEVTATYPCTLAVYGMTWSSCTLTSQLTEVIQ